MSAASPAVRPCDPESDAFIRAMRVSMSLPERRPALYADRDVPADVEPWGPSESDWLEYAAWSRELEARREVEDDDEREAIEVACGNRTPSE